MITYKILVDEGIALINPSGPLSESDFIELTKSVDEYLETHTAINGILIHTRHFPGWEDFGGFVKHLKFVKGHHRNVRKIALVTESKLGSIMEHLVSHFVSAEIRWFGYPENESALEWITSE